MQNPPFLTKMDGVEPEELGKQGAFSPKPLYYQKKRFGAPARCSLGCAGRGA
jgi:hypothetical protein